jgi:hypothetical protein
MPSLKDNEEFVEIYYGFKSSFSKLQKKRLLKGGKLDASADAKDDDEEEKEKNYENESIVCLNRMLEIALHAVENKTEFQGEFIRWLYLYDKEIKDWAKYLSNNSPENNLLKSNIKKIDEMIGLSFDFITKYNDYRSTIQTLKGMDFTHKKYKLVVCKVSDKFIDLMQDIDRENRNNFIYHMWLSHEQKALEQDFLLIINRLTQLKELNHDHDIDPNYIERITNLMKGSKLLCKTENQINNIKKELLNGALDKAKQSILEKKLNNIIKQIKKQLADLDAALKRSLNEAFTFVQNSRELCATKIAFCCNNPQDAMAAIKEWAYNNPLKSTFFCVSGILLFVGGGIGLAAIPALIAGKAAAAGALMNSTSWAVVGCASTALGIGGAAKFLNNAGEGAELVQEHGKIKNQLTIEFEQTKEKLFAQSVVERNSIEDENFLELGKKALRAELEERRAEQSFQQSNNDSVFKEKEVLEFKSNLLETLVGSQEDRTELLKKIEEINIKQNTWDELDKGFTMLMDRTLFAKQKDVMKFKGVKVVLNEEKESPDVILMPPPRGGIENENANQSLKFG